MFTDIEGSTQMLRRLGDRYPDLLSEHDRVMREAIAATGGREVETAGDSFFVVFSRASAAVDCARRAQLALAAADWPGGEVPRVRVGIHTGAPAVDDGKFVGLDVHRAARVMAAAHGGQVLVTEDAGRGLGTQVELRDLGYHPLKDLPAPEHLFQVLSPGLATGFPPIRSLNHSNLPVPANPLVGREVEVSRARDLLAQEDVRLLTLLGPGGAGKSRLAIDIAAESVTRYRDGVWMVPLAPIADQALMAAEMARVLNVAPVAGEPLEQTLIAALAERELLLVLDTFEHLLGAATLVADVLGAAPDVDVLVTSRQALQIRGEHLMDVPPLAPADATELFLQRASAVRPGLTVDCDESAAVERMCARLDGLPLALELAAARVQVFRPRVLEARLAERLALPEGSRDLPERQRTLRATIDWSYQLLTPGEREQFQSLAPFIGGVRVDTAEAIWGSEAVEALVSLAEKSLLHTREDRDGEPRFWMLETVREFATERARAEGGRGLPDDRHGEHFLALTDAAAEPLRGSGQRQWLDRLEDEYPNLRGTLDHLTEHDPERALRMAGNLIWFWDIRGYVPEAMNVLDAALAAAPADSRDRALALFGSARMALLIGEREEVQPRLLEALSFARPSGDERLVVLILSHLGWVTDATDPVESVRHHEDAVSVARSAGDDWALGVALNNHAVMSAVRQDFDRACSLLEEALRYRRRIGEPRAIALTANNLAELALDAGDLNYAETLIDEAITQAREIDFWTLIASTEGSWAALSLARGDLASARAHLHEAILAGRTYDVEFAASLLSVAGTIAAAEGAPTDAALLWAAGDHARARAGRSDIPTLTRLRARYEAEARTSVQEASSWESARATGSEISIEEALALADGAPIAASLGRHDGTA